MNAEISSIGDNASVRILASQNTHGTMVRFDCYYLAEGAGSEHRSRECSTVFYRKNKIEDVKQVIKSRLVKWLIEDGLNAQDANKRALQLLDENDAVFDSNMVEQKPSSYAVIVSDGKLDWSIVVEVENDKSRYGFTHFNMRSVLCGSVQRPKISAAAKGFAPGDLSTRPRFKVSTAKKREPVESKAHEAFRKMLESIIKKSALKHETPGETMRLDRSIYDAVETMIENLGSMT